MDFLTNDRAVKTDAVNVTLAMLMGLILQRNETYIGGMKRAFRPKSEEYARDSMEIF